MKHRWLLLIVAALTCRAAVAAAQERRFALLVGNDRGGRDTRPLVYASSDARRLHDVLTTWGGVRPQDATLLLNRNADDVTAALARIEREVESVRARGARTSLLLMVDAFVGPRWRRLYESALGEGYRFLSFGDAMLLDRSG